MDIEGCEYRGLLALNELVLNKFKQIVIEFHCLTYDDLMYNYADKFKVLEKLTKTHYLIHAHANNNGNIVGNIPTVIELTYVNKSYFNTIPKINKTPLPIDGLDFPNNPKEKDINLNFYPYVNNIIF